MCAPIGTGPCLSAHKCTHTCTWNRSLHMSRAEATYDLIHAASLQRPPSCSYSRPSSMENASVAAALHEKHAQKFTNLHSPFSQNGCARHVMRKTECFMHRGKVKTHFIQERVGTHRKNTHFDHKHRKNVFRAASYMSKCILCLLVPSLLTLQEREKK